MKSIIKVAHIHCPCSFVAAETPNNGGLSLSPPHSISQRETMQITQPASAPTSPLASPNLTSTSFNLTCPGQSTVDPNWQASKPTVRERNAAMFNNELMADIRFVVGSPGTHHIKLHVIFMNDSFCNLSVTNMV
jgi:BTB/POZ domain-containing protein 3/6